MKQGIYYRDFVGCSCGSTSLLSLRLVLELRVCKASSRAGRVKNDRLHHSSAKRKRKIVTPLAHCADRNGRREVRDWGCLVWFPQVPGRPLAPTFFLELEFDGEQRTIPILIHHFQTHYASLMETKGQIRAKGIS